MDARAVVARVEAASRAHGCQFVGAEDAGDELAGLVDIGALEKPETLERQRAGFGP
jgi:hypothetical protein